MDPNKNDFIANGHVFVPIDGVGVAVDVVNHGNVLLLLTTSGIISLGARDVFACSAHPFVIMWIVDVCFDFAGRPIESGVTLDAPHLVASGDAVDAGFASRTRFCVGVD